MRKWIKRILMAMGGLVLALFLAVYFGGRWAAQKYLARDIAVGEGTVRLVSPRFLWSLDLSADSVLYSSPALDATMGRTSVSADLFKSLLRFSPAVALDVDTLSLALKPTDEPDTVKPKKDSIPFPDFRLPAAITVRAQRVQVSDSGGPMAQCDGLEIGTTGPQGIRLSIREIRSRHTGTLRQSLAASASWEDSLAASARAAWKREGDSVHLAAELPKANLLRATAELRVWLASSDPYMEAFKLPATLPRVEGLAAGIKASMPGAFRVDADVKARVSRFPDSLPLKLGPQNVAIRLGFADTAGTWSVTSRGAAGEDVDLRGNLYVTGRDSLANPAWLAAHAGATAKGHLRGFAVTAAGKRGMADLTVRELRASGDALKADIATGDGSRIAADLRKAPAKVAKASANAPVKAPAGSPAKTARAAKPKAGKTAQAPSTLPDWNGTFSIHLAPGERWLAAFTDTNVAFKSAGAQGSIRGGEVTAVVAMTGLKAYGVSADSLRLHNRYGREGYELRPSHLYWNKVDWELSGRVRLDKPGMPMSVHLGNAGFGTVDAAMPAPGVMEAHIRNLAPEKLPYAKLDTLKANQPRVTADFRWDRGKKTGAADVKLEGRFKSERLQARAQAEWDAQALVVKETKASLSGNEITAAATIRLRGRQFYELAHLAREDFESVSLGADRFDLAKALAVAMPEPPLKSGMAVGKIAFGAADGFSGSYKLENIHLNSEEEKIAVKELSIQGRGDALVIKAVTLSEDEPLFRDSVTLEVAGVLGKIQTLNLKARAGQDIFVDFRGEVRDFTSLRGRLGIRGDVVLPGSSGEIKNLRVGAEIAMPFKEGSKGLSVEADTLGGVYMVAGLDTQTFSAPVKMIGGKIVIPKLSMKAKNGAQLSGRFEFDPATKRMAGSLAGNSFSAQFGKGDKVKLRDVKVDLKGDSTNLDVRASIGSGSAEHIKAPMRAAGDFSRVQVVYNAPMGKERRGSGTASRTPYLGVDITLDSSEVRYRLRSMETLQNLFKRSPEGKRAAKRSSPMQLRINVETSGSGNSIETDILRVNYVGNFSMAGTYPYALVQGRVSSQKGELGTKKQAYAIKRMEIKWLNTPMEEGDVQLEATKRLARDCEAGTLDSCNITTRLTGELSDLQFTYDSDCEGASGAGVEVAALVYSVRRGCYSSALRGGGSGLTYQEQALGLLEPMASSYLTDAVGKLSGHWISSAQVTGLSALASDRSEKDSTGGGPGSSSTQEAIALEILSKEFWRTRLRVSSAYAPENTVASSPWNYRVGLEWRPPLPGFIDDPRWQQRLKNNVNVEAAIFTDPDRTQQNREDESLRKRLGLNYTYDFWGGWWGKKSPARPPIPYGSPNAPETGRDASAADSTR